MKRSAIARRTPLAPGSYRLKRNKRVRQISRKTAAAKNERRAFVAEFLARHPTCAVCPALRATWRSSVDVHETLRRSAGGAIVPGPKADAQGQEFLAVCRDCHDRLTNPVGEFREQAIRLGWIQSRYNRRI